ncbi:MAG TPA: rhomboid family intramembrane serine protease, partial [Pirellulales bacterium]|nr:rhomboid family intramembrane serine protease [Pirellulales bacterium]
IVVNAIVFAITAGDPEKALPWLLVFGDGLHPLQWISNNFLHADFMHILGNMFYLWGFGLVVEGKLGWWRFLLLYLVIGAVYGAIVQTVMLGSYGGALGASGVIFGLMIMALIWAPKNEMNCFLLLFFRPILLDVSIIVFATTYLIWQGVVAWLSHFSMSSAMLHLTGAAVGAVAGVIFLKFNWVDCEGWDLLAVWQGKVGSQPGKWMRASSPPPPPPPKRLDAQQSQFLAAALRNRLRADDGAGAAEFYRKQRQAHPEWELSAADLMALIQALHKQKRWSDSVLPMNDYARQFPTNSTRVRLKLAQVLLEHERQPAKALKVLGKVSESDLPTELRPVFDKLTLIAEQRRDEADFELADDNA